MLAPLAASADDNAYLGEGSPAPESKIHDGALTGADFVPHSYFVQLAAPATTEGGTERVIQSQRSEFLAHAQAAGVSVEVTDEFSTLWNGLAVTAEASSLATLAETGVVEAIFPMGLIEVPETPASDYAPQMGSAVDMTGVNRAHEMGYRGEGLKIGIIDTGVDYDHPDFGGGGTPGGDTFPTERVAYGYDFVGDSYNADTSDPAHQPIPMPDEDPDDCQGHGTHVAGISSADGEVVGVAPDSTIGAYRVFGCEGSTTAAVMLKAMEMSLEDEMDVVNLSIGSAFSSWAEYPTARATDALAREGVVVVASIGNSGANGLYSGGAPGVGLDTIGVGSVDNVAIRSNAFLDENDEPVPYTRASPSPAPPTEGTAQLVALAEPGTEEAQHCEPFTDEEAAEIEDNWVLIQRGECTFHEKALNGQNAGAAGVVIYNNVAGALNPSVTGEPPITIPVVGVMQEAGTELANDALASDDGVTITFTAEQFEAPNPTGGLMSSFSSFGPTADLRFKPDVSAPGGSIYAPYPLESGGFATLSGTSMAAPHAAGAAALLLEADPDLSVEGVKLRLQNSSEQIGLSLQPTFGLEVVHRQGSGLIQVDRAIEADITAEPGLVQLGQQLAGETSTQTVTVHNHTGAEQVFTLSHTPAVATVGTANDFGYYLSDAAVTHPETVTVPAGGSVPVELAITSPLLDEDDEMGPTFGGYIEFATGGDGGTVYTVAYGGSAFDLQDVEVLADMVDADGNVTQELPVLARVTACEIWNGNDCVAKADYDPVDDDTEFTMAQGDHPVVLVHFEHQARHLGMEIYAANEDGTVGESVGTALTADYLARSTSRNGFTPYVWDGMVINEATGARERVPNGDYIIGIDVTKASAWNDDREPGVESYSSQSFSVAWSDEGMVDSPAVQRIEGHNRYATASELAVTRFEPGVDTVFIANGLDFPDAVAGGALAVSEEGPVLLTRADSLPEATKMALQDLAPEQIVVLGGELVVSDAVETALEDYAEDVERVSGKDRYRTAAEISGLWEGSDVVFLASGADFPDALSAAAAAGVEGAPVLLTRPHGLPGATAAELERLSPSTVYVIGGSAAVSDDAAEEAGDYADEVVRLGGTNRYSTASNVAQEFFPTPTAEAFLATGADFPDALAAAPAAALNGGPVLLTRPHSVPSATMTALDALRAQTITLVGGFGAISLEVQQGLGEHVYQ